MSLINTEIKPFKATAFHDGKFVEVTEATVNGRWSLFFFSPADFTFVCTTEHGDLRPVEARALAEEARKADPTLPGPWEIEATLLDAEDRGEDARAAFAKAAAAGSKKADVYYRLAQLEWAPNPDRAGTGAPG